MSLIVLSSSSAFLRIELTLFCVKMIFIELRKYFKTIGIQQNRNHLFDACSRSLLHFLLFWIDDDRQRDSGKEIVANAGGQTFHYAEKDIHIQ